MSSSMVSVHSVKVAASNYLHGVDLSPIDRAWEFAVQVHQEQKHFSGELYLLHLQEVARNIFLENCICSIFKKLLRLLPRCILI